MCRGPANPYRHPQHADIQANASGILLGTTSAGKAPHDKQHCAHRLFVNLETSEKLYTKGDIKHMCPKDGWVCFRNSELLSGRLGKATLGGGNKSGLFQVLP